MLWTKLSLLFFAVLAVESGPVMFSDCGSEYHLKEVDIQGCNDFPCKFRLNTYQNVTLRLKSKFYSREFTHSASLEYPVITRLESAPKNPCERIVCPFRNDKEANFTMTLTIPKNLLQKRADLFITMHNENAKEVVCVRTDVLITS